MKKIFSFTFILLIFSAFFCAMSFGLPQRVFAENETTISSATELQRFVMNYGSSTSQNANIVLASDIDMTGIELDGTIGTDEAPFLGTFDGKGYTISNLNVNTSVDLTQSGASIENNQYAGLFGVVNGATIKNIAISGNVTLKTGGCLNAYVGALAGKIENSTIQYVQVTAKTTYQSDLDCNTYFGGVIGSAVDSQISECISRSSSALNFSLTSNNKNVYAFGGVVGSLSNSQLSFAVVGKTFNVDVSSTFAGNLNVGGIVGVVSQGGSKIVNIACQNSFALTNNATSNSDAVVKLGEVAGQISNPSPNSKNISYIHYKPNVNVERFGDIGNYTFSDSSSYDYITISTYTMTDSSYFENQLWHPLYSDWDFSGVWYFGSSTIYLQSFYGDFSVKLSSSLNSEILKLKTPLQNGYRFGEKAEISLAFNDITENGQVVGNMSDFYSLSAVVLNGVEKAKIVTNIVDGKENYRISGSDLFEIENVDGGFILKINGVNQSTAGEYNITTQAKTAVGNFSTRLYKNNDYFEGEAPGYVFYAEGSNTNTEKLTLSKMSYGQTYRIETKVKSNTANAFYGWYKVDESGDVELGNNAVLEFTYGQGEFIGDFDIYAKYNDNACLVTFKMDGGVYKVDLYSGNTEIEQSGSTVPVSKGESSLKIEIYIMEDYEFDVEKFITELDTYKTEDPNRTFCTLRESYKTEDGYNYYHFSLDMTTLQGDFANAFNINIQTEKVSDTDNSWIWYVVGGVTGVLVIGLVVLLIVLLKRRGGGYRGGSGTKSSYNKKNFKNMYY